MNLTANTAGSFNVNFNGATLANGQAISSNTVFGTPSIAVRPVLTCNPGQNLSGENQYINGNCFAVPRQRGESGGSVLPQVFGPAFFNSDLGLYKNIQLSESKRIQFRFNAFNFLNHPLYSFRNDGQNTRLIFNPSTGKIDNPIFGVATEKQGRRIVMLTLKFYF